VADINVERKKRPGWLPWIVALIIVVVLFWAVSRCSRGGREHGGVPAETLTNVPAPAPADSLAPARAR
jgi:hypothetical protein